MSHIKYERAFALAYQQGIHSGTETRKHIWQNVTDQVPADVLTSLSSKQLAAMIVLASKSYHAGRASCKASVEDDCVYIGAGVDKLIPLAALKKIKEETTHMVIKIPHKAGYAYPAVVYLYDCKDDKYVSQEEFFHDKWTKKMREYYTVQTNRSTTWSMEYVEKC